jgi:serine/threonine protein kinase
VATPRRDPFGIVGTTVDRRYHVRRLVAEGGFGVVYEAEAIQLGMPVALKVLRGEVATSSTDARARFLQEAKVLVRLRHAAIVELTDAAHLDDGTPYLVLAWLDGETLDAHIQRVGPMPLDDVIALLAPVASAIEHAHAQGVIHRDLKPTNLMVLDDGVKVLDFGVARWSGAQAVKTTTVSNAGLSIGFAAPEQYGKEFGPIDGRTDQFALAGVVYSALTALPPFPGETVTEVMFATCNARQRPSVHAARPEISEAVDKVLQRALSVRPADRYATIDAFWRALGAASIGVDEGSPATDKTGPPQDSTQVEPVATLPTATFLDPPRKSPSKIAPSSSIAHADTERADSERKPPRGTVRQGEAPQSKEYPPSSAPPSSMVPSRRGSGGRIVAFVAIGCIVGAGIYVAIPWIFPDATKPRTGDKKPIVSATSARPSSSVSASASASSSAEAHGPCGELGDTEACIVSGKLHRGPDDCTGTDRAHKAACPQQTVLVATFAIDKREVSAARYRKCVDEGKCRAVAAAGVGDLPARDVTFADAKAFCVWDQVGPKGPLGQAKRLPTDDEWELAAAGPGSTHREYPWSNDFPSDKLAVFSVAGGAGRTEPLAVGSIALGATPEGVLDLGGNVSEWTATPAPPTAPTPEELEATPDAAAPAPRRWVRGGSFKSSWDALRTWARDAYPETIALPTLGFRCARTIKK